MTVKDMIITHLRKQGFDGLYTDDCGCSLEDLLPCDSPCDQCRPGFFQEPDEDGIYPIGPESHGITKDN